jgi:hypothetical protein
MSLAPPFKDLASHPMQCYHDRIGAESPFAARVNCSTKIMIAEQLQSLYNVYSDWFLRESPGDGLFSHPALMYAVSCTIAHVVTVWTFHVSMYALYITHSFSQYKIDPKWPEKKLVIKALKGKLLGLAIGDLIAW